MLPNGKQYCAEDATTEKEQDTCLSWLESAFYAAEQDKKRTFWLVSRAVQRLKLARSPCRWWQVGCRRTAAALAN